jgi:hypothetical protein
MATYIYAFILASDQCMFRLSALCQLKVPAAARVVARQQLVLYSYFSPRVVGAQVARQPCSLYLVNFNRLPLQQYMRW